MHQIATPSEKLAGRLLLLSYLLLGAVSLWVWNPHFEESFSQWKLIMGMSQSYTRNYTHFNDTFLLQHVFEWLYGVNSAISWFPLALWLVSYIASGAIFYLLWRYSRQRQTPLLLTFLLLLAAMVLLSANWLWIHHNRTAFLVGLWGSLLLVYGVRNTQKPTRWKWAAGSLFLIGLSMLFRAEAGVAVTLLLLPSVLYIYITVPSRWTWGLLPLLPVALALCYFFYQAENNPDFRWRLEPDVEHELMDRHNHAPFTPHATWADSVRQYAVAQQWMLGDVQKNDAAYIRSLINKPDTRIHRYFFFLLATTGPTYTPPLLHRFAGFAEANTLFLLLLGFLFLTAAGRWWCAARLHMALFGGIVLVLLAGSFTVHQFNRITQPLLAVTFCWAMFLWLHSFNATNTTFGIGQRLIRAALMVLAIVYIGYSFTKHTYTARAENRLEALIEKRLHTVLQKYPQRKWVLTAANYTAYKTPALQPFTGFGNKTLLIPEIGQYSANPAFLQTIANLTGCPPTDFKCRMQFIDAHKSETIIIATEKRLHLYETYMQAVYGVQLNWSSAPRIHLAGDTYFWLP